MKKSLFATTSEINELTDFLPKLYPDGFSPIVKWGGGEKQKDGSITLPYPSYNKIVEDFFLAASKECWRDYEYSPEQTGPMLQDEALIKTASLAQIKTMLTFCVRGERFCGGHWGAMIQKGYIRRLLERLNEIKSE